MKKTVSLFLLICLLFTGFISYRQVLAIKAEQESAAAAATEVPVVEVSRADRAALFASHAPDEIIATVDGKEVRWDEYFYFYNSFVEEVEYLFTYFGSYGYELTWGDEYAEGMLFSSVPPENEKYCGEGASEEQLAAYLADEYLPMPVYQQMLRTNALYRQELSELYGGASDDGSNEAQLGAVLQEKLKDISFSYVDGFTPPVITDYVP